MVHMNSNNTARTTFFDTLRLLASEQHTPKKLIKHTHEEQAG